jgi:hypothetical protein
MPGMQRQVADTLDKQIFGSSKKGKNKKEEK